MCLPAYRSVFPEGGPIRLVGPDPYFHLRHVKAVLSHYPQVERHDYMTNFPAGEKGINQGFFDVLMATIVKMSGGHLSPELVLAWVSPICLLITALIIFIWFLRSFKNDEQENLGERCGAIFLLFLLLHPGSLAAVATLGQGDHHVVEILLAALVAISLHHLLQPQTSLKAAPLAAFCLFVFYLTWAGAPLHLLIVGIIFYIRAWRKSKKEDEDTDLSLKGSLYGGSLIAALLMTHFLTPWAVIWGLSERIFILGATLLTLGYPILVRLARRPWQHPSRVAIGIVALAIATALLIPSTRGPLLDLFLPRTRQIAEHVPFSLSLMYSGFGLVWPIAMLTPVQILRRKAVWEALVPFSYGFLLLFFWWQTFDYIYYIPPIIAAGAAYTLGTSLKARRLYTSLLVLALVPLISIGNANKPWASSEKISETILTSDGLEAASSWLKAKTNPAIPAKDFPYGLVCPWDLGNVLAETANTPVGWSQTVSSKLAALLYTKHPGDTYRELTQKAKPFRYLLVPARNLGEKYAGEAAAANLTAGALFKKSGKFKVGNKTLFIIEPSPRSRETLLYRLYWDLGNDLGHYRLAYDSPQQVLQVTRILSNYNISFFAYPVTKNDIDGPLRPLLTNPFQPHQTPKGLMINPRQESEVKIFELVPGALLQGKARPKSLVEAKLALYAPSSGRSWTGRWSAQADEEGNFSLRLPYATTTQSSTSKSSSDTVTAEGLYRLTVDGKERTQAVSESEIQSGRTIKLTSPAS